MDGSFWRDRPVFLTGHTGFKGGWLSLWLESRGAKVTGYSLAPPTTPSLFSVGRIAAGINSVTGDIRDLDRLKQVMAQAEPEVVFHLAAQSLVRPSYATPVETFATNVMGTVHVLEAARSCGSIKSVVIVTSDKCYENREWVWPYREDEAMGGHDPYSASKGCTELVTAAFRKSYFSDASTGARAVVGSARAGNVIGGGDWAVDRLVPDIIRAASSGQPVRIRNPGAVRPWQHVLEPLSGYIALAERLALEGQTFATGWNFGPWENDTRPVEWITREIVEHWGDGASWIPDAAPKVHEAHLLKLDSAKARTLLGWRPRLDLETALAWTVSWYKAHAKGEDMRRFTLDQIRQYETKQA